MKKMLYTLTCTILVTLACVTSNLAPAIAPTFDPNAMQTAIFSTALAAQNQTQAASVLIGTPVPTNTLLPTETLLASVSFTYEGTTISCTCADCFCLTNQSFTVRITIDAQGYVTGIFEQYLPEYPAIILEGPKSNILGLVKEANNSNNSMEFIGSLSEDLSTLNATLLFKGDGPGKRVLLFIKKQ